MTGRHTHTSASCTPDAHAFRLADKYLQLIAFWAPRLPPEWQQPLATDVYLQATSALSRQADPIRNWANACTGEQPTDLPWWLAVLIGNTALTIQDTAATIACATCAASLTRGMASVALRYFDPDFGPNGMALSALHRNIDAYTPR